MSRVLKGVNSDEKMGLIQINLNHCGVAQSLLSHITNRRCEWLIDRNLIYNVWVADLITTLLRSDQLMQKIDIRIYSCSAASSLTLGELEDMLDRLIFNAVKRRPKIISDFKP